MAASIVKSTTSPGFANQKSFDVRRPLVLMGGGARSQVFTEQDLSHAVGPTGDRLDFHHAEYILVNYLPLDAIERNPEYDGLTVCKLPLHVVCAKFTMAEIRDLSKIHEGLKITSRHVRKHIDELLDAHKCTPACEDSYAVLSPHKPKPGAVVDVESPEFAESFQMLPLDTIRTLLPQCQLPATAVAYEVKRVIRSKHADVFGDDAAVSNIPLAILSRHMSVQGLKSMAIHHNISLPANCPKPQRKEAVAVHECDNLQENTPWIDTSSTPLLWDSTISVSLESYPPKPTSMIDIARAMRGYCAELTPEAIEESGCCVCGQLTKKVHLIPFDETVYELTVLEELGCTRKERRSIRDPICDIPGPVLDSTLNDICPTCHESLKKNKRPKFALANRLWVGSVPACLQDLTLGEAAMVSRVRYNRCVVRVGKGHLKMTSNVIAFEHPSKKIYQRLPMDKDELADVLSVMYTGSEPPGDDDLKRTPVLVRRNKVRAALEWLKLNHKDYADLSIAYDTLETYPLENVPVGLLQQTTIIDGGNVLAAAKSVFDSEEEQRTEDGPCPFTVTALTSKRHTTMTPTQRKLPALQHLKNGGMSLAIGHDGNPQSMWNNPSLYPQMFPWLFPYGLGGVGQDEHLNMLSRENHIPWLLMYHDKRFQTAASPLMVFFNHSLIRQSSSGSFITMKRRNFLTTADAIEKLDASLLLAISE
ncbi:hypothetical protein DFP72DRAFT_1075742 [Ephemerocybe angulata]|uniref:DUF6570 domain-containing protein n=1 Tax=Ephemerocybe angulata TaxID=980116 RepID=A0A8H6LZT7_9AGAR|nr:hypothetical protein DFP72DRAFT_1075742 [Tulosesus angulatus]